jgi:DNA-binding response OmpR family regulator
MVTSALRGPRDGRYASQFDAATFCRAHREAGGHALIILISAAHPDVVDGASAACAAVDCVVTPFDVEDLHAPVAAPATTSLAMAPTRMAACLRLAHDLERYMYIGISWGAEHHPPGGPMPGSGRPTRPSGKKVLLVEDNVEIRELLRDKGYEVVEAADGGAAIRLIWDHCSPPAELCLVLLDMMLPVSDGV